MANWKYPIKDCKEKLELCLNQIGRETGLHIINVKTEDAAYAWDEQPYHRCNFHIMEIPGVRFALWCSECFEDKNIQIKEDRTLWTDYYNVPYCTDIIFFCDVEDNIDKFKPTYGEFVTGIYQHTWFKEPKDETELNQYILDDGVYYLNGLEDILEFMVKHPIKSYAYIISGISGIEGEISNLSALRKYIHMKRITAKYRNKTNRKRKRAAKIGRRICKKLKNYECFLMDTGNSSFVQMELRCRHKKDYDKKTIEKDWELLDKYDNKYSYSLLSIECWEQISDKNKGHYNDKQMEKNFYNGIKSLREDYKNKEGFVYRIYYDNVKI